MKKVKFGDYLYQLASSCKGYDYFRCHKSLSVYFYKNGKPCRISDHETKNRNHIHKYEIYLVLKKKDYLSQQLGTVK